MIIELRIQTPESGVSFLQEELKMKSFLPMSLITDKQNANSCSKLLTTPVKSTSSSSVSIKQTLSSNKNIDFHIDNGLKNEHVSEVNKVKKVFFTTDNNQIKYNKIEKQTIYATNDRIHTTTKSNNNKSNNYINDTNSSNKNDNIQDIITLNLSPNPPENESPDQPTGEWQKGAT